MSLWRGSATSSAVMPGLDPGIHPLRKMLLRKLIGTGSLSRRRASRVCPGVTNGLRVDSSFANTASRSRRMICASFSIKILPSEDRGRREDRVRAAPAVSCAKLCEETHTSIQVQRKHSGLPRAMVLRFISRSPWRPGFLTTIAPDKRLLLEGLDASVGASGPHDFAVRLMRARQLRIWRPPHLTATPVTIARRPSIG
jgi:hypothetical protein